jgi:hypothetical protein
MNYLELLNGIKEINIVNDIMNNVKEYNRIQKILNRFYNLYNNIEDIDWILYRIKLLDSLDEIENNYMLLNDNDLLKVKNIITNIYHKCYNLRSIALMYIFTDKILNILKAINNLKL